MVRRAVVAVAAAAALLSLAQPAGANTLNFNNVRIAAGATKTAGPVALPSNVSKVFVLIDRTAPNGLNSLTAATVLHVEIDYSDDNGVTWQSYGFVDDPGGIVTAKGGGTQTQDNLQFNVQPVAGRITELSATCNQSLPDSGGVTVSGSITAS